MIECHVPPVSPQQTTTASTEEPAWVPAVGGGVQTPPKQRHNHYNPRAYQAGENGLDQLGLELGHVVAATEETYIVGMGTVYARE